jgi:hypothetical protein
LPCQHYFDFDLIRSMEKVGICVLLASKQQVSASDLLFVLMLVHTLLSICVINRKNRSAVHNWVKIVRASDWWRPFLYPSQPMGAGRSWCRRLYIWYVTQKQKDNILLCIWVKQPVTIFPTGIPTWFLFGLLKPI